MLTDAQCRNASCPPNKKRARLTDYGGLYLEISPAGSKRWFWKTYADGKESRMALGGYPATPLTAARKARDETRMSTGLDLNRRVFIFTADPVIHLFTGLIKPE